MTWLYENKVFDLSEEELEKYQGFVYEVEECDTGMKYIGKKFSGKRKSYLKTNLVKENNHSGAIRLERLSWFK